MLYSIIGLLLGFIYKEVIIGLIPICVHFIISNIILFNIQNLFFTAPRAPRGLPLPAPRPAPANGNRGFRCPDRTEPAAPLPRQDVQAQKRGTRQTPSCRYRNAL